MLFFKVKTHWQDIMTAVTVTNAKMARFDVFYSTPKRINLTTLQIMLKPHYIIDPPPKDGK